jgi:rhamnose transport system permease protein
MTVSPVTIVTSRVRPEQLREGSLVLIIVLLIAFFSTQIDGYLSGTTFTRISASFAIVAVLAVGQTLVVLTRNVDLSVGSIVGLIAYGVGTLLGSFHDLQPLLVIGLCLVFGGVLGAINGVIVSWGRVPAIVTTLGTLAIFRVLLVELSGSKTVTTDSLPAWVVDLPRVDLLTIGTLDIRPLVVIALAIAVLVQLGLRYLPFGRRLFAIGSNPEGAHLVGMPVKRDVFLAFTLSGALAGLAGFMFLSRFGNITVAAGLGLELQAVAAVVVGGVNIFGGIGSIGGAVLGAFLIDLLSQSLTRMEAVSEFTRDALLGLLILLAVASDSVILARLRAGWQSARAREMARREAEGAVVG